MLRAGHPITHSPSLNLFLGHIARPNDGIALDDVVRPTREPPVSDGWRQGHRLAVVGQRPSDWSDGRNDLQAAATKAIMNRRGIGDRHIQDSALPLFRDELDELVPDFEWPLHSLSSLIVSFPAITNTLKNSLLSSS